MSVVALDAVPLDSGGSSPSSISIWESSRDGTAAAFTPMASSSTGPLFSSTYLGNILTVSNLEAGPVARLYSFRYEQTPSMTCCPFAPA